MIWRLTAACGVNHAQPDRCRRQGKGGRKLTKNHFLFYSHLKTIQGFFKLSRQHLQIAKESTYTTIMILCLVIHNFVNVRPLLSRVKLL